MGCKWTRHVVVGWGVSELVVVGWDWTRHVVVGWGVSGLDML